MTSPSPKRVVIIGGGLAGMTLARALDNDAEIALTVIEKRDFIHYKIGALRAAAAAGAWSERALIPTSSALKSGKLVRGAVAGIDVDKKVIKLEGDEQEIAWDYLVIASGSRNFSIVEPLGAKTREEMKAYFAEISETIKKSKHVLITGSGPVSIELAGEIRDVSPDKKITILPGVLDLLATASPPVPNDATREIRKVLESRDVKVEPVGEMLASPAYPTDRLNTENAFLEVKGVKLASGVEIPDVDLVLFNMGSVPTTSFVPEEWLDPETKEVKINKETFEVVGRNDVFSFGDAAQTGFTKLAYIAGDDAGLLATSIRNAVAGSAARSKAVRKAESTMLVTVGQFTGRTFLGFTYFGDLITAGIKGRGLFESRFWRSYGAGTAPAAPGAWLW